VGVFVERLLGGQRPELVDQLVVAAQGEVGLDALFQRVHPQLLEVRGGRLLGRSRRHPGQGRATPEPERGPQPVGRDPQPPGGGRRPAVLDQLLEPVQVELSGVDPEQVSGTQGHQPARPAVAAGRPEGSPQPVDVVLERHAGRTWRLLAPEPVDELLGAEDAVGVKEQRGQQGPLLGRVHRQQPVPVAHLDWPEDPELHPASPRSRRDRPANRGEPPTRVIDASWPLRRR
jgi:hypothetical protein